MPIIIFLSLLLATWRVAHLLAKEDGPGNVLANLRHWLGVRYPESEPYDPYGTNVVSTGIICVWCNSVWVGLGFALLYVIWNPLWLISLPLALSAGAVIINEWIDKED